MTDRKKLAFLLSTSPYLDVVDGRSYESAADDLISNGVSLETKQATSDKTSDENKRWIPVTERLPKKGTGSVLVVKQFRGKSYVDIGEVMGGRVYCYSDEYCVAPKEHIFTHWMPLPEMPKEG